MTIELPVHDSSPPAFFWGFWFSTFPVEERRKSNLRGWICRLRGLRALLMVGIFFGYHRPETPSRKRTQTHPLFSRSFDSLRNHTAQNFLPKVFSSLGRFGTSCWMVFLLHFKHASSRAFFARFNKFLGLKKWRKSSDLFFTFEEKRVCRQLTLQKKFAKKLSHRFPLVFKLWQFLFCLQYYAFMRLVFRFEARTGRGHQTDSRQSLRKNIWAKSLCSTNSTVRCCSFKAM